MKMRFPYAFVWMIYEWGESEWWSEESASMPRNCTRDQMEEMLEDVLVLSLYQSPLEGEGEGEGQPGEPNTVSPGTLISTTSK